VAPGPRDARISTPLGDVVQLRSPPSRGRLPVSILSLSILRDRPDLLADQLCQLVDAWVANDSPKSHTMVLGDGHSPQVRLCREVPFTDTEVARAGELRRLALRRVPTDLPVPTDPDTVVTRRAEARAVDALIAMHGRCSAETLLRRYRVPTPRVSPRLARSLLEPADGLSLVMTSGQQVVAVGMLAWGSAGPELGLMVEDRWQRHGLGTRLLRRLAVEAASRGVTSLVCHAQPDNHAVLATVRRAGLRAHVSMADGAARYEILVTILNDSPGTRGRRRNMGQITTPLASLLHERAELRDVYPPADFIDRAVRDGA
jgi:ribosomal protein S18 acetylase RimI-like enzyme